MCSYCGCDSIECVGRFMAEHSQIITACGALRRAVEAGDDDARVSRADVLAGLLEPHTHAEEVGLFHVLREEEEFTEHVDRLCAEHTGIDELLAAVRSGDGAAMPELERSLRAHIDHEDNGLFPAAAVALAAGDAWERVHALTPPPPGAG